MGRMKKEFDSNGTFQKRFRDLYTERRTTQKELAIELGVSRPTVAGWLDGKNIPDILSLTKLAQFFKVSSDYLLGLSDTENPDVNARAAVEYTGLSEEAVERLHAGLVSPDPYEYKKDDAEKKVELSAVSKLISSRAFEEMIRSFTEITKWAYLEKALLRVRMRYNDSALSEGKTEYEPILAEDREKGIAEMFKKLDDEGFYVPEYTVSKLKERIEECLSGDCLIGLIDVRESLDRHQFLASKALMEYLEELVKEGHQRAG